ncbi:DNA-binding response regulator [Halorhodospira abdelmalekii]|uniref:response regulator transcription factor n=1 Tax=Halorhodospira abdelmalekii TaxID=421629 RepID=UPI001908F34C|nr:response regulator transcription factor [Halorhodospira abdelmalekii]MBK1733877.1 DNA-binding response regulator [Halorhodospira abdelmalekii]
MHVLIVEDHADLAANIADFLSDQGHLVDVAGSGLSALHIVATSHPDALILDLGLPDMDGVELCRRLRAEGYTLPIVALTARSELEDKVGLLDLGADDYLVKPVALREIESRLRAQLRRAQGTLGSGQLQVADLLLDEQTRQVKRAGRPLRLTRLDFQILQLLMQASPAVVTRERLERALWGDEPPESDALRTYIHRLRRVVDAGASDRLIHTVRGIGYRLTDEA